MPDRTEIIARAETSIRYPNDFIAVALENRDARYPAIILAISHVSRELTILMRYHLKAPTARLFELLLLRRIVRTRNHKCCPILQMFQHSVETVRPQRAIGTSGSHVMYHE